MKKQSNKNTIKVTKAEIVTIYALLIRIANNRSSAFIFRPLNGLIIHKWSIRALEDIKNAAWKIVDSGKTGYEIFSDAADAFEAANAPQSEIVNPKSAIQ